MNKIVSNTFALFSAKSVMLLASLALAAILARRLGPEGYGDFRAVLSLCALLGVVIELGLDKVAIRECSVDRSRARIWVGTTLLIKIVLALAAGLTALIVIAPSGRYRPLAPVIFLGLGIYAVSGLANTLTVVFRSREVMGLEALVKTAKSLFLLALVYFLARSVASAAWIYFFSALFQFVFSWLLVRRLFFPPAICWEGEAARRLIRGGALIALAIFFNSFQDVVRLIVYWRSGAAAAGYYSAGASFFQALEGLVPLSLVGALFPAACRLRATDRNAFSGVYRRSAVYLQMAALPFAVISLVLSPRLCGYFFGPSFTAAAGVVRVLGIVSLLMVQNYLLFDLMVAAGKERLFAGVMGAGALINAASAFFLVAPFGPAGAAAGAGLAQLFLFLVFLRLLRDDLCVRSLAPLLHPLPAAAAMAAALWGLSRSGWPLPLVLLPAFLVYGGGLIVSGALNRDDWNLLRGIITLGKGGK